MMAAERKERMPRNDSLILIVEDEAILRNSMARGLSRLPGVEIAHAGNLKDAREIINALSPRVVITDLDLPDGSGAELIAEIEDRQLGSSIIVVSAYIDAHSHQLSMRPDIEVREKPLPLEQLRQLVREKMDLGLVADDSRQPFSVVDYVQLACMGQRSVEIAIIDGGTLRGRLQICLGELWAAGDEHGKGNEALRRLLFQSRGHIEVRSLEQSDTDPRNLEDNWQWLLMEAARLSDEVARTEPPIETISIPGTAVDLDETACPAPVRPAGARSFEEWFDDGVEALLGKRYSDAYIAFCHAEATSPGDRKVVGNLERLRQMGYAQAELETPS